MILDKVLITGSSNGLGKHLALYFLEKGHEVILHGRNKKQLEAISSSVKLKNRSIKYYVCDLLEEESVKKLAEFAKTENVKILFCSLLSLIINKFLLFKNFFIVVWSRFQIYRLTWKSKPCFFVFYYFFNFHG